MQHLQELVQLQAHRNRELELALERIGTSPPPAAQSLPVFDPSVQLTHTASPQITAPFDEELFDMTSNMELA